jgi:hypothetical protein
VRILKRRWPIVANLAEEQEEVIAEDEQRGANLGFEAVAKSKILFHFIKGKIFLSPMETILVFPGELEYLEGLVKLARRRKDAEGKKLNSYCPFNPCNPEGECQQNSSQQNIASSC